MAKPLFKSHTTEIQLSFTLNSISSLVGYKIKKEINISELKIWSFYPMKRDQPAGFVKML